MKKLLNILGAITLIGTASTSVIACGGGEKPNPPAPDTRTDLITIITTTNLDKIIMSGATPTKQELLTAIQEDNAGAKHLPIAAFDIEGTASATKAKIKGAGEYKGEVDLTYEKDTRTDLITIITTTNLDKIIMSGATPTKQELLTAIQEDNAGAKHLPIAAFDIEGTASATKAKIKGAGEYKGEVDLTYEKDTRTDINEKITSLIVLEKLDTNTASEFLIKLQAKLMTISGLSNIKITDYDVYKANTINEKITDNDITTNTSLNIKIIASPTSQNFRGSNQNIVVNFQKKLDSVLTNTDLGTINIPQSIIDDSDNSKIEWLILSYLKSNNKNKILTTLGIDVSDVQIDKQKNTGTAKVKSNNKNYYTGDVNISFVVSREKIDLNQLVIDQYSNTDAIPEKKMKDLDISNILIIFKKIKLTNPTIEYQDLRGNNINENAQKKGLYKVKITADKSDPNYKGTIVDSGWKLN